MHTRFKHKLDKANNPILINTANGKHKYQNCFSINFNPSVKHIPDPSVFPLSDDINASKKSNDNIFVMGAK